MSSVSMMLVGKERFLKKDKSGYWHKIHYISEFNTTKNEVGCVGFETGNEFVSEECWHTIKADDINKNFEFEYGTNEYRKPEVIGLRFLESK